MGKPWVSRLGIAAVVVGVVVGSIVLLQRADQRPAFAVHGDGLADTHDGFQLVPVALPQEWGEAVPAAFQIIDKQDRPLTQYDERRGHRLHLYLTRDDLHAYQHVYPKLDGDTWRTTVDVPDGGQYRLYAEFVPRASAETAHPILLGVPFVVPGDTTYVPLPAPAASAAAGGVSVTRADGTGQLRVGRDLTLRFRVSGTPQPHLGGYGELTALSANTLAMLDVRPEQTADDPPEKGELSFQTRFAERGEHRLMLEFRTGGKVRVVGFTVFVT
ncbi:MAG: hypothetical protein ACRDT4_14425 [Micromonosporaceae bacterium]